MGLSSQRWKRVTESAFPWEAEALEFLRARLPDCDPYFGWTNFSFIADDGTVHAEAINDLKKEFTWQDKAPNR